MDVMPNVQQDDIQIRGIGGGRGGFDQRGRGPRNRGSGRGILRGDATATQIDQQHPYHQRNGQRSDLVKIVVKGVLQSDAANESDNGLAACREWLEKWANRGITRPMDYVSLKSVS